MLVLWSAPIAAGAEPGVGLSSLELILTGAVVVLLAAVTVISVHYLRRRTRPYAYLYRLEGKKVTKFAITHEVCRIGRHPHNEVRINDKSVSRFHAELVRNRNGTFSIFDVDSKNGLRVGFRPVQSAALREGDLIDIGKIRFKFTRYPRDYNVHRHTVMLELAGTRFEQHRRRRDRHPVAMNVRIYNDEAGWITGRVRDLSAEGAFIETDRNLSPRVPVDMVFPVVDGSHRRWVRLSGEVVREDNQGVGVSFTDNDPSTAEILRTIGDAA